MRKRGMALALGIAASVTVLGLSGQVAQAATPDQGAGVRAAGKCTGNPTNIRPEPNTKHDRIDTCGNGAPISILCWLNGENTEGSRRWYLVWPAHGIEAGFAHSSGVFVLGVQQCD